MMFTETDPTVDTIRPPAPNAQHSSVSVEHYTPIYIIRAAREVMGDITLDPASCIKGQVTVQADRFFDQATDGLKQSWANEKVWLNPPGGICMADGTPIPKGTKGLKRKDRVSSAALWWEKLCTEGVDQAIFLAFSIEFLQTAQKSSVSPLSFPFCIPSSRIDFLDESLMEQGSPTHSNCLIFVPPEEGRLEAIGRFHRYFSPIGQVVIPQ